MDAAGGGRDVPRGGKEGRREGKERDVEDNFDSPLVRFLEEGGGGGFSREEQEMAVADFCLALAISSPHGTREEGGGLSILASQLGIDFWKETTPQAVRQMPAHKHTRGNNDVKSNGVGAILQRQWGIMRIAEVHDPSTGHVRYVLNSAGVARAGKAKELLDAMEISSQEAAQGEARVEARSSPGKIAERVAAGHSSSYRPKVACKFFKSKNGCHFGASCQFSHGGSASAAEGSPRGDERAIGASSGVMASSGASSAVSQLLQKFRDLYDNESVQNALTVIKKDVSLMQNDNLPGEDSSGYKFVRERYHGRLWATRPPGPNVVEDQRKILSTLIWNWIDMLLDDESKTEGEDVLRGKEALRNALRSSNDKSRYTCHMVKSVLAVFLPLERANALYFMQIVRNDPTVPRGIGWYSREDFEDAQRDPENHKVFTLADTPRFPLSRSLLRLITFFELEQHFQPLLSPILLKKDFLESHNRSSEVFHFAEIEDDVLGKLEKHQPAVHARLDRLGLFKTRVTQMEISNLAWRGIFNEVYRAKWFRTEVAVKKARRGEGDKSRFLLNIETEVMMLHKLRHPNILTLLFVYEEDQDLNIVTEWCGYGSLLQVIENHAQHLEGKKSVDILMQVAAGMAHLHNEGIVHCDLSVRNVLCKGGISISGLIAQVADMGLAREVNANGIAEASGPLPLTGIAPEALRRDGFYLESDVWSFGCLVWQTFSRGQNPFPLDDAELTSHRYETKTPLERPIDCPEKIYEEICRCTAYEREKRPSMLDVYDEFDKFFVKPDEKYALRNADNSVVATDPYITDFADGTSGGFIADFRAETRSDVTSNDSESEEEPHLGSVEFALVPASSQPNRQNPRGNVESGGSSRTRAPSEGGTRARVGMGSQDEEHPFDSSVDFLRSEFQRSFTFPITEFRMPILVQDGHMSEVEGRVVFQAEIEQIDQREFSIKVFGELVRILGIEPCQISKLCIKAGSIEVVFAIVSIAAISAGMFFAKRGPDHPDFWRHPCIPWTFINEGIDPRYDLFLSHNGVDKAEVLTLHMIFRALGVSTFLDLTDITGVIEQSIVEGLGASKRLLAWITSGFFHSPWACREMWSFLRNRGAKEVISFTVGVPVAQGAEGNIRELGPRVNSDEIPDVENSHGEMPLGFAAIYPRVQKSVERLNTQAVCDIVHHFLEPRLTYEQGRWLLIQASGYVLNYRQDYQETLGNVPKEKIDDDIKKISGSALLVGEIDRLRFTKRYVK